MNRASKIATAFLVAAVALASIAPAFAQTGPTGPGKPTNPVVNPTNPTPAVKGMTEADLASFLRTLDPNLKVNTIKDGTEYHLTIQRDGWNFQLRVTSFANEIWIDSKLGAPINAQQVQANLLAELLAANFTVGPTHFSFVKMKDGQMQLDLGRCVLRGPLTVDGLRGQINLFVKQVKDTYPTWNAVVGVK